MTEVTRALVIRLATAPALLAVINNSHSRIKQATDLRFIAFIRAGICNFNNRALLYLIGTKDAKLNTNNWFYL